MDSYRLFKRASLGLSVRLVKGPLTTNELARCLMKAKGMDLGDTGLAKAIGNRLIHSLRMQEQRGRVRRDGKRKGVSVLAVAET